MTEVERAQEDILLVDDTPANLRLLSQMLGGQGYRVRAVTSGARALESARATPPALVLLDIRMPEMDGYQVCEALKADARTCEVPVIFISALDDLPDKVRAFRCGGVDYITKPFQLEEVLVRTETHLALRRLQKRLEEANTRLARELALAGQIQASFLPQELPRVSGWELAAALRPARETSGDFYDVMALPDGLLGLLVADVVDKGAGAALFMALSCSLMRTYAAEYPADPVQACQAANRRLLADTGGEQFVTLFYGVLQPGTGELVYSNAGQCPALHIGADGRITELERTGPPLGVFEDGIWGEGRARIAPGETLILYTDGVTEAEDAQGCAFGTEALARYALECRGRAAAQICDAVLARVSAFSGHPEHQSDDIALVVVSHRLD